MARTAKPKAVPAPEPEETDEGGAVRGPGEMHELFSEWLKAETGVTVTPEAIFLVTSKRTAFRKSDEYLEYAEGLDAAREEAKTERAEKAKARAEKAAEEPDEDEAPKPTRRGKAPAKKAASEETGEEATVTPMRGRSRRKAVATEEEPADEAQAAPAKPAARRRRSAPANF